MTFDIWITYTLAASVILIIPGPTILLVISHSLTQGRTATLPLVVGVTLGDFVAMTLSLAGLGAILATSATLFLIMKWIGAAYLIYLGIRLWRSPVETMESLSIEQTNNAYSLFRSAFIVTMLNPKGIIFFVAFLPQFVNPLVDSSRQLLILGATFLILAAINATIYAVFAGKMRQLFVTHKTRLWFNRCGAVALVGAGVLTGAMRRSQ